MGLRSFVALPVDKQGTVVRLSFDHAGKTKKDQLVISAAHGISARQTFLLGMPYRLSPGGNNRLGDASFLYRQIWLQQDHINGTDRFAVLGGMLLSTEDNRDPAVQIGVVSTHFRDRYELDFDVLYQAGIAHRPDAARYDLSWQYRLAPTEYPKWGIAKEWYGVLELNGRWREGSSITHQVTAGIQWVHPTWVLEGGVIKDINSEKEFRYLMSLRYHF